MVSMGKMVKEVPLDLLEREAAEDHGEKKV